MDALLGLAVAAPDSIEGNPFADWMAGRLDDAINYLLGLVEFSDKEKGGYEPMRSVE